MAIIATFETITDVNKFRVNGIELFKIFNVRRLNSTRVDIINVYDNNQALFSNIAFNEVEVDGVVYGSVEDLITNLTPVVFRPSFTASADQAQIDAIQQVINNLSNLYADINHLHEGVYLTEQEIINLIQENPNASDIASGVVDGNLLRFFDANEVELFNVNCSAFRAQGTQVFFDGSTNTLRLLNSAGAILSSTEIVPSQNNYDQATYVSGIDDNLNNLVLDGDFMLVQTINESVYFVKADASNLTLASSWRLLFPDLDFKQDLGAPDITDTDFVAYELTNFDASQLSEGGSIEFTFWNNEAGGGGGGGDMLKSVYDPTNVNANAFSRANHTGQEQTADIANQAITNPKLANMNANTIKGRATGNGTPQDLTVAQTKSILNYTLRQVLAGGNSLDSSVPIDLGGIYELRINDNDNVVEFYNKQIEEVVFSLSDDGFIIFTNSDGRRLEIDTALLTQDRSVSFPDESGTLVVDAPVDGKTYLRKNGAWVEVEQNKISDIKLVNTATYTIEEGDKVLSGGLTRCTLTMPSNQPDGRVLVFVPEAGFTLGNFAIYNIQELEFPGNTTPLYDVSDEIVGSDFNTTGLSQTVKANKQITIIYKQSIDAWIRIS